MRGICAVSPRAQLSDPSWAPRSALGLWRVVLQAEAVPGPPTIAGHVRAVFAQPQIDTATELPRWDMRG